MLSATISDHLMWVFIAAWTLLLLAAKLCKTVDSDGEVTDAAEKGLADWLKRLLK